MKLSLDMLTPREFEVLAHLSQGDSNRKIALDLHICERTVKNHVGRIYRKVGIPSGANKRAWIAIQMERKEKLKIPDLPKNKRT